MFFFLSLIKFLQFLPFLSICFPTNFCPSCCRTLIFKPIVQIRGRGREKKTFRWVTAKHCADPWHLSAFCLSPKLYFWASLITYGLYYLSEKTFLVPMICELQYWTVVYLLTNNISIYIINIYISMNVLEKNIKLLIKSVQYCCRNEQQIWKAAFPVTKFVVHGRQASTKCLVFHNCSRGIVKIVILQLRLEWFAAAVRVNTYLIVQSICHSCKTHGCPLFYVFN